jgi:hypothetical protein
MDLKINFFLNFNQNNQSVNLCFYTLLWKKHNLKYDSSFPSKLLMFLIKSLKKYLD